MTAVGGKGKQFVYYTNNGIIFVDLDDWFIMRKFSNDLLFVSLK